MPTCALRLVVWLLKNAVSPKDPEMKEWSTEHLLGFDEPGGLLRRHISCSPLLNLVF